MDTIWKYTNDRTGGRIIGKAQVKIKRDLSQEYSVDRAQNRAVAVLVRVEAFLKQRAVVLYQTSLNIKLYLF